VNIDSRGKKIVKDKFENIKGLEKNFD